MLRQAPTSHTYEKPFLKKAPKLDRQTHGHSFSSSKAPRRTHNTVSQAPIGKKKVINSCTTKVIKLHLEKVSFSVCLSSSALVSLSHERMSEFSDETRGFKSREQGRRGTEVE